MIGKHQGRGKILCGRVATYLREHPEAWVNHGNLPHQKVPRGCAIQLVSRVGDPADGVLTIEEGAAARRTLWEALPSDWRRDDMMITNDIAVWNDAPGRTVEEVIAVFEEAAK